MSSPVTHFPSKAAIIQAKIFLAIPCQVHSSNHPRSPCSWNCSSDWSSFLPLTGTELRKGHHFESKCFCFSLRSCWQMIDCGSLPHSCKYCSVVSQSHWACTWPATPVTTGSQSHRSLTTVPLRRGPDKDIEWTLHIISTPRPAKTLLPCFDQVSLIMLERRLSNIYSTNWCAVV